MSKPLLIGVCVGHSRAGDKGAVSVSGMTEWAFNCQQAALVCAELAQRGLKTFLATKYDGNGYGAAMSWLGAKLDSMGVTHAIELHFNASDGHGRGHEWLHWATSEGGRLLATSIDSSYRDEFPELKARGLKPITSADRGADFLLRTRCPAVICEPFFGDNPLDWQIAVAGKSRMAKAIAAGIANHVLPKAA